MNLLAYNEALKKAVVDDDVESFKQLLKDLLPNSSLTEDDRMPIFTNILVLVARYTRSEFLKFIFGVPELTFLIKKMFTYPEREGIGSAFLPKALHTLLDTLLDTCLSGFDRENATALIDALPAKTKYNFITAQAEGQNENRFMQAVLNGEIEIVESMLFGLSVFQQCHLIKEGLRSSAEFEMANFLYENILENRLNGAWDIEMIKDLYIRLLAHYNIPQTEDELPIWSDIKDIHIASNAIVTLAVQHNVIALVKLLLAEPESTEINNEHLFKEWQSALILAARLGHSEIVKLILDLVDSRFKDIASFLNEVDESVGPEDTALIEAARNGHINVVQIILDAFKNELVPIINSLNRSNAQGETAFIVAACNEHTNVIKTLFTYIPDTSFHAQLLIHQDQQGKTGFIHACEKKKNTSTVEAIFKLWSEAMYNAICNSKEETVRELLGSVPKEIIFRALKLARSGSDFTGDTLLMIAVKKKNLNIVKEILSGLTSSESVELLDQKNNKGDTAYSLAKKMKTHMGEMIEAFFLDSIQANNANASNQYGSDSLTFLRNCYESQVREKLYLTRNSPSSEEDRRKKIREDDASPLYAWSNSLMHSRGMEAFMIFLNTISRGENRTPMRLDALLSVCNAIYDKPHASPYDDLSNYTLGSNEHWRMQVEQREQAVIASWYSVYYSRSGWSLTEDEKDYYYTTLINGLVVGLTGLHSGVSTLIVSRMHLEVPVQYLLISEFNCKDYTIDQLVAFRAHLTKHYCLTVEVQQILIPKLKAALNQKFDKFIDKRFVTEEDQDSVINKVLSSCFGNKLNIRTAIEEKLFRALGAAPPLPTDFSALARRMNRF